MPRSCRRSASAGAASWLLAAPATTRQRSSSTVVGGDRPAHRARRVDVALGADRVGRVDGGRSRSRRPARGRCRTRAPRRRTPARCWASSEPTAPRPWTRTRTPRRSVPSAWRTLASDAVEDAHRGGRRGATRTAVGDRLAEDVFGPLADRVHVALGGVDVGRGGVQPAERADEVAVAVQQLDARLAGRQRRHGQDGLPAAHRDVADRHLARHRGRQLERVREPVLGRRVDRHPRPAARAPVERRVHADEHPGREVGVVADGHLLPVPARQEVFEGAHVAAHPISCKRADPAAGWSAAQNRYLPR